MDNRGLNRFPEISNEPLPQWFFDSIRASHRPAYWKPIPEDDTAFRRRAFVGNENGTLTAIQSRRTADDPFYYRDYQLKFENDNRLPETLFAKNTQRPLGTWRTYQPTREQITGEKDPDWKNRAIGPGNRIFAHYQQQWLNAPAHANYTSSLRNRTNRAVANNYKNYRSRADGMFSSNYILDNTLNERDRINVTNHVNVPNCFPQITQPMIGDNGPRLNIVDTVRNMKSRIDTRPLSLYSVSDGVQYNTSTNGYKILTPKFNNANGTTSLYHYSNTYNGNPDKANYSVSRPRPLSLREHMLNNGRSRVLYENQSTIPDAEYKTLVSGRKLAVQARINNVSNK